MDQEFSLSPTVILRCEPQYYGSYASFDFRKVKTEFLKEAELKALECIYARPAEIDEISKETGMKRGRCEKFIKRMTKSGYVQVNADLPKVKPPERVRVDPELYGRFPLPFLSAPASVDVFITSRCNLNCVHCFSGRDRAKQAELSLNDLKSIFSQLEQMGVLEVRINGGEPLLHREIAKILPTLSEKRFRKVILTNGTLLNEEILILLKDSGTIPTVSLDDSEEAEHDLFRGVKGSYERTIEALKLLQKHGIQYGINCCLHRRNLNRHQDIINLAVKYGAYRIAFLDLKQVGRMKDHPNWVPSYTEYQETFNSLLVARAKNRKVDVSLDAFMHCYPLKECVLEARKGFVSCKAGISGLSIDSEGSVYPCGLVISDTQWNMGNIKKEKLQDIWFSDKWLFFRGKTMLSNLHRCKDCTNLKRCKDFYCRLLPYSVYGDPLGPHPKCYP
jgi:radical SAM protein with 4Fe4S-binding SPASM domain